MSEPPVSPSPPPKGADRIGPGSIVALWAVMIGLLVAIMAVFGGATFDFRFLIYGAAVLATFLLALLTALARPRRQPSRPGPAASGAPSAAIAVIVLICALAVAYTFWLAFLALPLAAFVLARARGELADARRRGRAP